MRILSLFAVFLFVLFVNAWTVDIPVAGPIKLYYGNLAGLHPEFKDSVVNLIDGDSRTYSINDISVKYKLEAVFKVNFRDQVPVDLMKIQNIPEGINDVCPAKDIVIRAYATDGRILEKIYEKEAVLKSGESTVIRLNQNIAALKWEIAVRSVYGNVGAEADKTGVAEIEFWAGGEKYVPSNLDELKKKYYDDEREANAYGVNTRFSSVKEFSFKENTQKINKRFSSLGIRPDEMERSKTNDRILFIQMTTNTPFDGKIYAGKKNGRMKKAWNKQTGERKVSFAEPIQIGEWKVDERGYFWIKIGNGQWKLSSNDRDVFVGTDLEGVSAVKDPVW